MKSKGAKGEVKVQNWQEHLSKKIANLKEFQQNRINSPVESIFHLLPLG